jgi:hypothetical protein
MQGVFDELRLADIDNYFFKLCAKRLTEKVNIRFIDHFGFLHLLA